MALTINVMSLTLGDNEKDRADAEHVLREVFGRSLNVARPVVSNEQAFANFKAERAHQEFLNDQTPKAAPTTPNPLAMLATPTPTPSPATVRQSDVNVRCANTDGRGMFRHKRVGLPDHNHPGQLFTEDCMCTSCPRMRENPKVLTYAEWELAAKAEQALYGHVINPNPPVSADPRGDAFAAATAPRQSNVVTPIFGNGSAVGSAGAAPTVQQAQGMFADLGVQTTPATPEPQAQKAGAYEPPQNGATLPVNLQQALSDYVYSKGVYAPGPDGKPKGLANMDKKKAVGEYVVGQRSFASLREVHDKLPTQITRVLVKAGAK